MSANDFNPLVFKDVLQASENEFPTIAENPVITPNTATLSNEQINTQLLLAHQELQENHHLLQEKFFALADVMYQMLSFINANRLYQNKNPIMANDIANIIENNDILAEMSSQLREAAIASNLGIITQFEQAQEYLRQHVMQKWQARFAGEERSILEKKLINSNTPASDSNQAADEIF